MKVANSARSFSIATLLLACVAAHATVAHAQPPCCVVPDIGGTAQVPPPCPGGYDGPPVALNGLPPGEPVIQWPSIRGIHNIVEGPGGSLGGTTQTWDATLVLHLVGGPGFVYDRTLNIPIHCTSEAAPRLPGVPFQSFDMALTSLAGDLPPGDPDFDLLRPRGCCVTSPGHTTLTIQPGGGWAVDSFFDITYRLDYTGAPGGPFAGSSNSQTESQQAFDMCHARATSTRTSTWGALKSIYR